MLEKCISFASRKEQCCVNNNHKANIWLSCLCKNLISNIMALLHCHQHLYTDMQLVTWFGDTIFWSKCKTRIKLRAGAGGAGGRERVIHILFNGDKYREVHMAHPERIHHYIIINFWNSVIWYIRKNKEDHFYSCKHDHNTVIWTDKDNFVAEL